MDKEKIVVILLLITIVLSIGSVLVTLNLNTDALQTPSISSVGGKNTGNVNLVIKPAPETNTQS
ncbi:MAG: hypothetical protein KJ646_05705 [Nanoarchaeota archaeon]|nr:hypothetical protein [Nanoarchaeota archaeon]